jgi:hypothetical protein
LAACAFLGAYLESACARAASRVPSFLKNRINPLAAGIITYAAIALIVVSCVLPGVSFRVLAPAGYYPVREADILMYARAEGNIVTPLRWGNYIMWRLYPRIKISMCGRYEAMYPESTSEMDRAFFSKSGRDWDRIVREHKVDYILLQPDNTRIRPSDLNKLDYELVWGDDYSALYARKELAPFLRKIASNLPPITIDPLDAHIPDTW